MANTDQRTDKFNLREVSVEDISAGTRNPRDEFDGIERLAESIETHGLMTPITVRAVDDGYEVVAGERRLRALKRLGSDCTMVVVRDVDGRSQLSKMLVENVQRADLTAREKGNGVFELCQTYPELEGLTRERLAGKLLTLKREKAKGTLDSFCTTHGEIYKLLHQLSLNIGRGHETIAKWLRASSLDESVLAEFDTDSLPVQDVMNDLVGLPINKQRVALRHISDGNLSRQDARKFITMLNSKWVEPDLRDSLTSENNKFDGEAFTSVKGLTQSDDSNAFDGGQLELYRLFRDRVPEDMSLEEMSMLLQDADEKLITYLLYSDDSQVNGTYLEIVTNCEQPGGYSSQRGAYEKAKLDDLTPEELEWFLQLLADSPEEKYQTFTQPSVNVRNLVGEFRARQEHERYKAAQELTSKQPTARPLRKSPATKKQEERKARSRMERKDRERQVRRDRAQEVSTPEYQFRQFLSQNDYRNRLAANAQSKDAKCPVCLSTGKNHIGWLCCNIPLEQGADLAVRANNHVEEMADEELRPFAQAYFERFPEEFKDLVAEMKESGEW